MYVVHVHSFLGSALRKAHVPMCAASPRRREEFVQILRLLEAFRATRDPCDIARWMA